MAAVLTCIRTGVRRAGVPANQWPILRPATAGARERTGSVALAPAQWKSGQCPADTPAPRQGTVWSRTAAGLSAASAGAGQPLAPVALAGQTALATGLSRSAPSHDGCRSRLMLTLRAVVKFVCASDPHRHRRAPCGCTGQPVADLASHDSRGQRADGERGRGSRPVGIRAMSGRYARPAGNLRSGGIAPLLRTTERRPVICACGSRLSAASAGAGQPLVPVALAGKTGSATSSSRSMRSRDASRSRLMRTRRAVVKFVWVAPTISPR